jgi:uncharacterized protein involved in exopolysaccharide biosynthesis
VKRRFVLLIAGLTALAIFLAGLGYALARTPSYQSSAALVLVPSPLSQDDVPSLIGTFNSSGSIGTYVELVASANTLAAAGSPPVGVAVRAVPDSRVVDVAVEGDEAVVQSALRRIVAVVEARQGSLRDAWTLETLEAPQPPQRIGPSTTVIVVAGALLAIVGAIFVLVAFARLAALAAGAGRPVPATEELGTDADGWVDEPLGRAPEYR